jgi:hypothetical protein
MPHSIISLTIFFSREIEMSMEKIVTGTGMFTELCYNATVYLNLIVFNN